ncbi:TetR/AcrR family transcriptional regulator [Lolliginicoccus levis]|uniref:TetR/AcrR family transcriptional regulator n=1 Tax=Lolliginicoccus levis TaxID=2919542 RepID=UPI00241CB6CA|nr:TetR/AcrR family transcriptional regulator [Lolliginicoccus levis]
MAQRNIAERLLTAGLTRFHEHGYHATGVQEITSSAGVPKGSFYNHYASKEALAVAAIHQYIAESPVPVLVDSSIESAVARLRAHFDELRRRFEDSGMTRGCFLGNLSTEVADHSDALRTTLDQAFSGWVTLIAMVLESARQAGEISRDIDTNATAHFLLNAWEGALLRARASRSTEPVDAFFALTFDWMLRPCS